MTAMPIAFPGVERQEIRNTDEAHRVLGALGNAHSYYATHLSPSQRERLQADVIAHFQIKPVRPRIDSCASIVRDLPLHEQTYFEHLPRRPYVTNDYERYGRGRILSVAAGIQYKFIKLNTPNLIFTLPFDVDRANSEIAWDDLAAPNWIATNRRNGHSHFGYILQIPVRIDVSNSRSMRFCEAISSAYAEVLGADQSLVNKWSKNPLHSDWRVQWPLETPTNLRIMSQYVDLQRHFRRGILRPAQETGMGRNCTLFETLRREAYRLYARGFKSDYVLFFRQLLDIGNEINAQFMEPLGLAEVQHTVKSVAEWTWFKYRSAFKSINRGRDKNGATRHLGTNAGFLTGGLCDLPALLSDQEKRRRQQAAGANTAAARRENSRIRIAEAVATMKLQGRALSVAGIARQANLHRDTLYQHKDLW